MDKLKNAISSIGQAMLSLILLALLPLTILIFHSLAVYLNSSVPIFCSIMMVTIIAGILGGLGIQSDDSETERQRNKRAAMANMYAGALASIVTLGLVVKVFEFSLEPLFISEQQITLKASSSTINGINGKDQGGKVVKASGVLNAEEAKNNHNVEEAKNKHKAEQFEIWLYILVLGILSGLVGRRVLNSISQKLVAEMEKRLGVELKEMREEQHDLFNSLKAEKLMNEAIRKQDKGFYHESIDLFNKTLEIKPSARAWSLKAYSESFLSNDNPYQLALKSVEEAVKLIDKSTDSADIFNTYYNRACYRYLDGLEKKLDIELCKKDIIDDLCESHKAHPDAFREFFYQDVKEGDFKEVAEILSQDDRIKKIIDDTYHATISEIQASETLKTLLARTKKKGDT